ncbi:MAG: HlyD family efflux transporter periplasmic adaptor subunit [Rhodobacteraceae bacterium]|nr:HlyD family efflux transporter periplasmic adaptor subunit [Paracoccaceae bacterium]
MADQSSSAKLPTTITRPLWATGLAMTGFLAVLLSWAILASIATTIRVNGSFVSSKPSYEIQHPFGGRIAQVDVTLHQTVSKGDRLFLLDVATNQRAHSEIQAQISALEDENQIIERYLADKVETASQGSGGTGYVELLFSEARKVLELKISTQKNAAISARQKLETVNTGIALMEQRRTQLRARVDRRKALVARGVVGRQETDVLADTILSLGSDLEQQKAQALTLQAEARRSELAARTLATEYRSGLLTRLNANRQRQPELRRRATLLAAEISSAAVTSPISGTVTELNYDTRGMFAGRGQTLVTLAQGLDRPVVRLTVPISSIDQVHVGMVGKLTVPALPQREMPVIRLRISTLSPEAQRNRDGEPIHYLALATINPDDMQLAQSVLGDKFRLATDMPVSAALQGRNTTMSRYLFGGFANLFTDALQE